MPHLVLFRESLGLNLADEGYEVTSFGNGRETLAYLQDGGEADVLLLDWRMPELTGIDVLRQLRRAGSDVPVIFLTALSDDIYEQAALEGGAVDFIDKSRRLPILLKRLELIAAGQRPAPPADPAPPELLRQGALELRCESHRALWGGAMVDLSLTEFRIVALLAGKAGDDVGYREIYDLVHGKDFVAGAGEEGYRANVRTLIKRIRKSFRDVDPGFAQIENYAGFGYRWIPESRSRNSRTVDDATPTQRAISLPDTPAAFNRSTSRTWRVAILSAGFVPSRGKSRRSRR